MMLIGLNAVSYVQKEKVPDSEESPNRSTYNVGATGTRALYDLLAETGRKVKRWEDKFPKSGILNPDEFTTFVIIGSPRREIKKEEVEQILKWVSSGGRLIIIDREPIKDFLSTTANWRIKNKVSENSTFMIDPSNQTHMVGKTNAIKPIQPTIFTAQVIAVQPSKFASSISISRQYNKDDDEIQNVDEEEVSDDESPNSSPPLAPANDANQNVKKENEPGFGVGNSNSQNQEILQTPTIAGESDESYKVSRTAPVIHLGDSEKNILVDYPFRAGQIIYLSDPYIITNSGIRLVDNAQLATNIFDAKQGIIAFDEFHQGYGRNDNRLFEYFSGTPVIPIFLQIILIIGLLFYSQSRRFARALPAEVPDRLSKLEYVSAMAQLQGRTKAYDLAVENVYREFRRRVSRLLGVDNLTAKREELAEKIAKRTDYTKEEMKKMMFKCEDIMHGEPAKRKEIIDLISQLRKVEESLGLRRSKKRNS